MPEPVKRTLAASKEKMQRTAKGKRSPNRLAGPRFRNSPGGRRLEELRKKKRGQADE